MDKLQALNWLVENVTRWPSKDKGVVSAPIDWFWGGFTDGEIKLIKADPTEMYADCHITQQEWLDSEPEKLMSSSDAFDWLYNMFSENINAWPSNAELNAIEFKRPCAWSWGNLPEISKSHAVLVGPPTVDCAPITFEQLNTYLKHEKIDLQSVEASLDYKSLYQQEKTRADALQDDLNSVDELHYDECEKLRTEITELKQQLRMKGVN